MTTTDSSLDAILDRVAMPSIAKPADLPAPIAAAAEATAKRAWHLARAEGETQEVAKERARVAYETAVRDASKQLGRMAAPDVPPPANARRGVTVDQAGAARSQADVDALRAAGFAPAEPLYTRGTMVVDLGVENARESRLEHEAKPLVADMCTDLIAKVEGERRRDVVLEAREIQMLPNGVLHAPGTSFLPTRITPNAFDSLCTRLGYGGGAYLRRCSPELRSLNVNIWQGVIKERERQEDAVRSREIAEHMQSGGALKSAPEPHQAQRVRLRERDRADGPEIWAAVSPSYTAFDMDKIAAAIKLASPGDARGTVAYDGERGLFEVMFHSDVKPERYVAGEVFKAGVIVRADDTGGGSVRVSAAAWQNLCLNLIIIDRCGREIARLRHIGSVEQLATKFRSAYAKALDSLSHFLKAWNVACEEDVRARIVASGTSLPTDRWEVLKGVFNGLLAGPVKVRGSKREETIEALIACWEADESGATQLYDGITRAAVVNAFTRFAQQLTDPWAQDEVQRSAGALLWGRRSNQAPAPLPFVALDEVLEEVEVPAAQA